MKAKKVIAMLLAATLSVTAFTGLSLIHILGTTKIRTDEE